MPALAAARQRMSGIRDDAMALGDIHAADPLRKLTAVARCCPAAPLLARMETASVNEDSRRAHRHDAIVVVATQTLGHWTRAWPRYISEHR